MDRHEIINIIVRWEIDTKLVKLENPSNVIEIYDAFGWS